MMRNRLSRMVSLIPVKLFKGENETLMEKVEAGKRQRIDEIRALSAARTMRALLEDEERKEIYGRLEQIVQKDLAERVKTPLQKQQEAFVLQDQEKRREASELNLQARKFLTPPQFGAICFAIGDAEEALTFKNSFK